MKIHTRLQMSIALVVVLTVTVGILFFRSSRSVKTTTIRAQHMTEVINKISELQSITHEYLSYFEGRALVQWQSVYDSLLKRLRICCPEDSEKRAMCNHILKDLQSFKADFFRLATMMRKGEVTGSSEDPLRLELKERLFVQLMVKLQATSSLALQLERKIQSELVSNLRRTSLAFGFSLCVLTALIVAILLWVRRSMAQPIVRLQEGVRRFGSGELDHKVGTDAKDEIGELLRAFDRMVEDLKKSTASIADLNREIDERKRMEQALRESERKYRNILETAAEGCWIVDAEMKTIEVNESLCKMLGYRRDEMIGKSPLEFTDDANRGTIVKVFSRGSTTSHGSQEVTLKRKDGEKVQTLLNATTIRDEQGNIQSAFAFVTDITEHKRLESELIQAQKLESVGRLAGGVAHDLNNTLFVILGYAELALADPDLPDPLRGQLEEVRQAAKRSAEVTRQLLAFARKQTIAPKVLNLNETIELMLTMIRRLIGENIDLVWKPGADLWSVKMDPAQIDQILANLCVNARDAIADVGRITVETENVVLDEAHTAAHAESIPGEYVMLSVSDTGCGMDKALMNRIFEPFFTTKEVGEGTGLGLATVHGIVKQNHGFINTYSELGKGTTFRIYFPRHNCEAHSPTDGPKAIPLSGQRETVLVVEDDDSICNLARKILEKLGYTVLTAGTPDKALELVRDFTEPIHLLITDVVMPQMNGREMVERVRKIKPEIKYFYMSGYPADVVAHHGILDEGIELLQKPFTTLELATQVRKVLSRG